MLLAQGEKDKAHDHWNLALRYSPTQGVKSVLLHAKINMVLGNWDDTCELYRRNLNIYPESVYLRNNIGICLLKAGGDVEEALESFRLARTLDASPEIRAMVEGNIHLVSNWDGSSQIRPRLLY